MSDAVKDARAALEAAPVAAHPHAAGQADEGEKPKRERGVRGGRKVAERKAAAGVGGAGERKRPAAEPNGDGEAPRRRRGAGLPEGCPVTPLGTHNGMFFYLDTVGQLRDLKARDHGNKDLLALFAPRTEFLHSEWPRMNDRGVVTGWRPEEAGEALMNSCAVAGVWNALDRVRGRGAWRAEDGSLVMHCGDAVLMGGAWWPSGMHGEHVYPAAPAVARPMERAAGPAEIDKLLTLLRTWRWNRPLIDPILLLGWMAAAMIGGALDWRPLAWITGDKGTGKSTLHALIKGVMGGALVWTSDASEAGIRQTLGHQSVPVIVDEAEADDDNRKLQSLVKLARQASSGGKIVRGGADHQAQDFAARSCFMLSSILIPPLQGQDRSRMAVLELLPLKAGPEPAMEAEWMRAVGHVMRRRLVDGFPRLNATLAVFRDMLKEQGHGARGADQFGALLACADLLLNDAPPSPADVARLAPLVGASELTETREDTPDSDRCLQHLLTSSVMLDGGAKPQTVAHWVARAAAELSNDSMDDRPGERALGVIGMRVQQSRIGAQWLAVAVAHQGLARLFQGTHWQARSGANGVWGQSLARLPGVSANVAVRVGGVPVKCNRLPLALCLADGAEGEF